MRGIIYIAGVVVILIIAFSAFTFTVDETQTAVLLQFNEIVRIVQEPGISFKLPLIQSVVLLDARLLNFDIPPREIITVDRKRLLVDNYAIWRIDDPGLFVEAVQGSIPLALRRLDGVIYSDLRDVLAEHTLDEIVSEQRIEFLQRITELSRVKLREFGIELVDVRIKRADLPAAIEQAVFDRMIAERQRVAAELRAEGERRAREITSAADRDVVILLAEAAREAATLIGEGEGRAAAIYLAAHTQNPAFFLFWRSLEAYQAALLGGTTVVLSTDSDFLRFFERIRGDVERE
ncbi:protease modulator HflC [Candidatus Bipolaricaulota bacterium]|nr:protease modulator HflC [Candidatus Bipolaricaulota bacterium]HBR09885.1 protease modulator HflC [Candidatus Acetothermia bacterium]